MVRGSATIMPITPINAPHTLRLSNMAAGPSPVTLPIMRGTSTMSCSVCTTTNTAAISSSVNQTG